MQMGAYNLEASMIILDLNSVQYCPLDTPQQTDPLLVLGFLHKFCLDLPYQYPC
uniref:Uncharacterized protein n=1 Tax=Arundo donax TaxID=35708 RepID=A0A0A9AAA9_ARUDO